MKRKVLLMYNTVAGMGAANRSLSRMLCDLAQLDCETVVYPIIPDKGINAESIIAGLDFRPDVFACCGGDGTLNHVINALMDHHLDGPIAYFPTGSANDFSKNIYGDNVTVAQFCRTVASGQLMRYDIGQFNEDYFNYVAAFGAFTDISYSTSQQAKNSLGYLAYALNVIGSLSDHLTVRLPLTIEYDGQTEQGEYLVGAVSNTRSVAGVQPPLIRRSLLDDGIFELILIQAPNNLLEINDILSSVMSGRTDNPYVKVFHAKEITITSGMAVAWTLDGENGGSCHLARIRNLHHAMSILVPPQEKNRQR